MKVPSIQYSQTDFRLKYIITDMDSVIFTQEIEIHGLATIRDYFVGTKLSQIFMERAVKLNIKAFLTPVSTTEFK